MRNFVQKCTGYLVVTMICCCQSGIWAQELAAVTETDIGKRSSTSSSKEQDQQLLKQVLEEIGIRYKVNFMFDHSLVEKKIVNKATLNSENFEQLLDDLLAPLGLTYKKIDDTHYIIKPEETQEQLIQKIEANTEKYEEKVGQQSLLMKLPTRDIRLQAVLEKTITGQVSDENDEPLPGVNVLVKNTTIGTVTDVNGNFRLNAPDDATTLVFSSVGYSTEEVAIENQSVINISLVPDIQALSEVVVTAFGIEKEKKALSYAVQEVEGEQLAAVGNTNLVNSLQGKVAGVIVKQSSGAPGSRSQITIRGSRSFVGNNEPLYVVDGLPISSGDRAIDINPNDIKSINVLKGPTAAALYGLRASNGVIVIETKKGEGALDGRPSVTFETNYSVDRISRFPETQTTYAQGERGVFNANSAFAWGPRIDTMGTYINQLGEPEEAAAYDNAREFFKTGGTLNANLTIANALDGGNYAISLGFADQQGIVENTGMQRINLKFAGGYDITDKLRISSSVNYANNLINRFHPTTGGSNLFYGAFFTPPSYDLKGKPTHEPGDPYKQINFRGQHDNIYWALENNYINDRTSRTFGNVSLDYKPLDWLSVNYRIGLDEYTTNIKEVFEKGSGHSGGRTDPPSGGSISNRMLNHRQINSNLNLTMSRNFGDAFNVDFMLGNEVYDIRSNVVSNNGSDIVIGGFHHISNTAVQTTNERLERSRVVGFFGNFSLSWQNSVFLNATGRNDIVSNMPRENRSFFYPSLGLGVVFTEFLSIPENILTFGKFRASVAEVGQAGPIYSTQTVFVPGSAVGGFTFPYQGLNAFTQSNQFNSTDLQPENTRTFEIGVDLRFVNDRIGLDYTYYNSKANGQIYQVPIAISTGYSSELRNAGEMSIKGHEIMLNITPVVTPTFRWDVTSNFTTYTNKVLSLAEGIEQLELGGSRVTAVAREGEEFPSLIGFGYARDPASGEVVVDSRSVLPNGNPNPLYGMPLRSTEQIILGSAQPDFEINFINNISYKNFSFSAQIDWRQGGKLSSGYSRLGRLYGILSDTENREADYVFPGNKGYYDEGGNLVVEGNNDITIQRGYDFYRVNQDPIIESNVYDATFVRLREVRLTYDLPSALLENTFIRSASFYLTGRNLWLNAALPHFDPEMFSVSQGEEYTTYPQTKSFGGGVRINF
ncbi:SusC/RagA family TonB-linked outer membrane protein [Catalinimonas niigatensis]|uniref:SusC/RagA family TonB-linked outer membrane protein n=1 Tax=Catalinimonas niigatensis TaxID=1397264 RepID=UPI0026650B0C|nr:SusC/RagA family TonB-linked outer membrane protein [Catalinimonas niigatensis]WPP51913.1 SusC/RagA family TonB-linked outer membrane protein [Catalinimonas niigatensis]